MSDRELFLLGVIVIASAWLAAAPDLLARLCRLRPLPLHRRILAEIGYRLGR